MKKEISEQLYLVTNGPLDAKVSPVDNVSDLLAIPRAHRYRGMTVMVLNKDSEEEACEYWLKDGTKDSNWVKKTKESPQFDPTDYYTSAQTDSAITEAIAQIEIPSIEGLASEDYVDSAITSLQDSIDSAFTELENAVEEYVGNAIENETARTESTYLKQEDMENYYTSGETDEAISRALENFDSNHYTKAETDSAISEAIGDIDLTNYYTSAQTDDKITEAVSAITVSGVTRQELNDAMAAETARTEATYLKEHQSLDNYYTSAQTDSAITEAVKDFATEEYVDSAVTSIQQTISDNEEVVSAALNDLHSGITTINEALESAVTSADVQEAIEGAMADETARTETTYLKKEAIENYYTSAQTDSAIQEAISGATFDEYATKEYVANQMAAETARTEATYIKQVSVEEDGFYIVDENGYIALSVTDEGVDFADKINTELVSNNEYDINI